MPTALKTLSTAQFARVEISDPGKILLNDRWYCSADPEDVDDVMFPHCMVISGWLNQDAPLLGAIAAGELQSLLELLEPFELEVQASIPNEPWTLSNWEFRNLSTGGCEIIENVPDDEEED